MPLSGPWRVIAAASLSVGGVLGCSLDWEALEPRNAGATTSQGGGAGGQETLGGMGGVAAVCGDGRVDPAEQCDDGNNDDGDGCDASCHVECDGLLHEPSLHCYAVVESEATWDAARSLCAERGLGWDLAGISSAEEHDWISQQPPVADYLIDETNAAALWLSGTDVEREGAWRWANGETPFFEVWADGEPSNDGPMGEHCAVYLRRLTRVSYDDRPCDRAYARLCERSPPTP